MRTLTRRLSHAEDTGGEVNSSEDASDDLAGAPLSLIEAACVHATA
jgi:hypothetical protein